MFTISAPPKNDRLCVIPGRSVDKRGEGHPTHSRTEPSPSDRSRATRFRYGRCSQRRRSQPSSFDRLVFLEPAALTVCLLHKKVMVDTTRGETLERHYRFYTFHHCRHRRIRKSSFPGIKGTLPPRSRLTRHVRPRPCTFPPTSSCQELRARD